MKKLSLLATALVATSLAADAAAAVTTTAITGTNLTLSTSTTSLTSWSGLAGTYSPYAALTTDQQAAEYRGTVDAKLANQTLPNTVATLPVYNNYAAPLSYGFGTTDLLVTTRQSEACTTTATPVGTHSKNWAKSQTFGNSFFGGGYTSSLALLATAGTGSTDKISVDGYAKANVSVVTKTGNVEGKAFLQQQGTTFSDSMFLKANGTTIWSHTGSTALAISPSWSRSLASGNQTIWLGPVPVSFAGSVGGTVGINASLSYASATLTGSANPYVKTTGSFATSISIGFAAAGLSGSGKFDASFPLVGKIGVTAGNQFKYDVDFDAVVSTQANINAWAKIYYFFGSKQWNANLVNYSHASTFPIVDVHGCAGNFTF